MLKVGDIVIIKSEEELRREHDSWDSWSDMIKKSPGFIFGKYEMSSYCGEEMIIREVERVINGVQCYFLNKKNGYVIGYHWAEWMFKDKTWIRYQKLRKLYAEV